MNKKILILALASLSLIARTIAFAQSPGKYANVNGMKMYYEIHGEGAPETAPLIVLHGAYMNIPSMGAIILKLAKTHKVYALEFQGHGRTTDIDRSITYPNLADDVAVFMDAVGIEKADVFGYSMGAVAGLQLAIRHPEKVNKLIAASGSYDADGWQPEFKAFIPQMTVEMMVGIPGFEEGYRKFAANPEGFPALVKKLIAHAREPPGLDDASAGCWQRRTFASLGWADKTSAACGFKDCQKRRGDIDLQAGRKLEQVHVAVQ